MGKAKTVKIDSEAIKRWKDENELSNTDIGLRICRSESYVRSVIKYGEMSEAIYQFMLKAFSLPYGAFIKKEPEPEPEKKSEGEIEGYELRLMVKPDRLKVTMLYKGQKMYSAYSKIEGNTELDLVQAVSYAAHMLYKQSEQKVLQEV